MKFTFLHTIDKAYAGIAIVMSTLSILSCLIIITVLISCKSVRTNGRTLLICLTVANLVSCVGSIVAAGVSVFTPELTWSNFPVCAAASAISIVSNVCAYLWTCAISLYVYLCISWKKDVLADKLRGVFHLVCWGFPVAVMVIATASDVIGFNFGKAKVERRPPWCWIDRETEKFEMWELVTGLGWRIATIIICTALYSFVQFSLSVQQGKPDEEQIDEFEEDLTLRIQKANRKLRHIPLIFVVLNAWGAWQEMASALSTTASWLVLMQVIGDHSQAFVNVILLCFLSKDVRTKLNIKCQSIRHLFSKKTSGLRPLELEELRSDSNQLMDEIELNEEQDQVQG
ncbi:G-protein coupled receptor 157-like isoform X1 [Mytilus trossulus]|uniref:G-protein coupled receptor 157-like isoform X1 n=1 Tax=Mytilus trossulus TaxID=6551 RepID=UPI003007B221